MNTEPVNGFPDQSLATRTEPDPTARRELTDHPVGTRRSPGRIRTGHHGRRR